MFSKLKPINGCSVEYEQFTNNSSTWEVNKVVAAKSVPDKIRYRGNLSNYSLTIKSDGSIKVATIPITDLPTANNATKITEDNVDPKGVVKHKSDVAKVAEKGIEVTNKAFHAIGASFSAAGKAMNVARLGPALEDDIFICENAKRLIPEFENEIERRQMQIEKIDDLESNESVELQEEIEGFKIALREVRRTRKAPCRTIKTTASVAGGWGAGIAGGSAGAWVGAQAGVIIGTVFGPLGIIICAPLGAVFGALGAGMGAGIAGSKSAEFVAAKSLKLLD